MRVKQALFPLIGVVMVVLAVFLLERERHGLQFTQLQVGTTPVTRITDGSQGPVVVLAHGPFGSRQTMQSYGQILARSGYTVYSLDFEGHGRHPSFWQGGSAAVEAGLPSLTLQVQDMVNKLRRGPQPVALVGHARAGDVLIRVAKESQGIGPLVFLGAAPRGGTDTLLSDGLLILGEGQIDLFPASPEQAVAEPFAGKTVVVPLAEQVTLLQSRAAQQETLAWLDEFYDRYPSEHPVPYQGWAIAALLAGIVLLFRPIAHILPHTAPVPKTLTRSGILIVAIVPALVTPFLSFPISVDWVPVPAVDGLIVHMAIYGVVQLLLLLWLKRRLVRADLAAVAVLAFWAIMVFGMALDRYGANFWPTGARLSVMAALTAGTVPWMIAHSWMMDGAPLWHRLLGRVTFFASLAVALALDSSGPVHMLVLLPGLVVFLLIFGIMARSTLRQSGPASAGLGLGLALAWAMGVTIPMYVI